MMLFQVNQLEVELSLMEKSRDTLETIRDNVDQELSSATCQLSDMDHLVDRVRLEERRCQEMILELNNNYNTVTQNLVETVSRVTSQLEAARENMETPQYMASIDLGKLREAETSLDHALERLMESYFSRTDDTEDDVDEMVRGRSQEEYERLVSEMQRLRVSWVWQEWRRIKLSAAEAGLQAVIAAVKTGDSCVQVRQETGEQLEQEILRSLTSAADQQCQRILNIDVANKDARNKNTISKLEVSK